MKMVLKIVGIKGGGDEREDGVGGIIVVVVLAWGYQ